MIACPLRGQAQVEKKLTDFRLSLLEFFASREPRPVKLQTQVFDLKLTDRNPDDVKALCYAIEESGLEHLKQHLPTLKQHLKQLLRDPDTIASNVHDIINIRSTIAEVQRELQQIGRQLSVQDYKDRFTTGDPKTLYARYASEPNGELKTLAAKLFKRVQWRDQLQNQAQKKGFWTSQVSNVRLRVVEQEIKMIKQSLTSMGRALDELIELRNEGASGNLSEDPRLTAWVLLRKRIQELQRENFEMFPEAGATARDIRLKPWDRKNRRPSTSQKTSFSEKQITPIGMTIQKDGFDVRSDQRLYDTDYVNPVDREAWENHLTANLAVYGREMDGKFKVPNVLLEYETGTLLDSRTEEILGELNAYGLQFTDKGVVYSVRTTEPVPGPVDVMTGYTTFFRSFWRNRNPPSSMSSGNSNNSFPLFFVMKVVNTTTEKDQRVGSIMVERDTEVSSIIELLKARYNSLRNLNQNTELYWKPSGAILRRNALVSRYFTGPSVFYFNVDVSVTAAKTFNREFVNVYARKRYDSDEMEEMDLFSDSDEDKRTTAAAPGPRKQKETFPKVPRAFDPSSPADRGGERGGGVLFYGAGDDYDMDW